MIETLQDLEIHDETGRIISHSSKWRGLARGDAPSTPVRDAPNSPVNKLETLITSIDVRAAILNNDYSKLSEEKKEALQDLLLLATTLYKDASFLGHFSGDIPKKHLTLEEKIRTAVRQAFLRTAPGNKK